MKVDRRTLRNTGLTPTQRQKRRRDRLRAEGKCVCGAMLLPEWGPTCPECKALSAGYTRKYKQTPKGRAADAAWKRREYAADPAAARQVENVKRQDRKERGICQQCSRPLCSRSSTYCEVHLERRRIKARDKYLAPARLGLLAVLTAHRCSVEGSCDLSDLGSQTTDDRGSSVEVESHANQETDLAVVRDVAIRRSAA